jgi:hypothetical protein
MDNLSQLIKELQETEKARNEALNMLETAISQAVSEMLDILFSLFDALKKENLTVRSYQGSIYPVDDGIVVYARGLEEKIVLNGQKKLIHYLVRNENLERTEIPPEILVNQIGSDKIYHSLRSLLRERIRTNKEDIINFRNQASKISKYAKDFREDTYNN